MKDRYWIVIYCIVAIFFGLSTGAGIAMSWYEDNFSIARFIFILTGLTLLVVLSFLNMKIGKILLKLQ
jgi:uncharacterized membrane protein YhaH (DUF805 family)